MPRKSSTSRARSRRLGVLALLFSAALTPAGIMVGTVTAAALVGGLALHLGRAAPAAPSTPAQSIPGQVGSPQRLTIERDGNAVSLVLSEDRPADGAGAGTFDPSGPLFAGLAGSGPAPQTAPRGMPPHASPGTPIPAGSSSPAGGGSPDGPASNSPPFAGPSGAPTGAGSPPAGSPPAGKSPGPSAPTHASAPHAPTGNGAPAQPPGEAGAPASPHEESPQPPHVGAPQGTPQPPQGTPEGTSPASSPDAPPGTPTPQQAGEPFNPLTPMAPPPSQKLTAQPAAVPEPSLPGLMLLGLAAMAWAVRRRPARAA